MTAEKLRQYVNSVELAKLSAADRAHALRALADKVNALPPDERRNWRKEGEWKDWFKEMTEGERLEFIEATLPTGFKQMLDSFAELPEEKRKSLIDQALKNIHDNQDTAARGTDYGKDGAPQLSPEMEKKVRALGLKVYYSESSAETKAELAPLVEELERQISSGRGFR
jgi:hypothetical protein